MSTLLVTGGGAAAVAVAVRSVGELLDGVAVRAAGARTWSVAVLVVVAATWLRSGEHLGDAAWGAAAGSALTAVTTRTIVHARQPSQSRSAVQPSSPPSAGVLSKPAKVDQIECNTNDLGVLSNTDTDTPTSPGARP